jgi:hypothetical protein
MGGFLHWIDSIVFRLPVTILSGSIPKTLPALAFPLGGLFVEIALLLLAYFAMENLFGSCIIVLLIYLLS